MRNIFLTKPAVVFYVFLLVVVSQITLPSVSVFFFGQWLVFVLIFLVSFFSKGSFSLGLAFLAGALIDLISGGFLGLYGLSLFSVALTVKIIQKRLRSSSPFTFLLTLIFCMVVFLGVNYLLSYVFTF